MRRLALLLLLAIASFATAADRPPAVRILFVGNSLTYTNDLPAMVARIAKLDGRRYDVKMIAFPNYSLEDHLASPQFRQELRARWDVVVLQQGPSSLDESRRVLLRDTRSIAALVPKSRVALLMVWPDRSHAQSMDRVAESYRLAAEAVKGALIPAGLAFREATRHDPSLKLLGPDGFHPAPAGTYLAALTTYQAITGHLPEALADPATACKIAGADFTGDQARLLFKIAGF